MNYDTRIGTDSSVAKHLLDNEEIVAIPTETVYGLAANAFSEKAVKKVYEAKKRPANNPLIVHVSSKERLQELTKDINDKAAILIDNFMPGPLTILLPKNELIPDFVTSGLPDVAIRIPAHPLTAKLLSLLDYPLAAPSANPFGYISPTNALHVFEQMNSKIPYILDGGQCNKGIESTIVGFKQGDVVVYRAGSVTIGAIESLVGKVTLNTDTEKVVAPGMFRKHYSPHTPLIVTDDLGEAIAANKERKIGIITYDYYHTDYPTDHQILLGKSVHMAEVAQNLYSALHKMDASCFDLIIVKKLPETDLGIAINEKLYRAAVI